MNKWKWFILALFLGYMSAAMIEHASPGYWGRLALSVDQFGNTIFGGDEDDTISARLGRTQKRTEHWVADTICWALDKLDPGHCVDSADDEDTRESKDKNKGANK